MLRLFLLFLFSFLFISGWAQDKSDSLKRVVDNYTKKDTTHVKNMARYAFSLSANNPKKAIEVFSEAIALANDLRWRSEILINLHMALARLKGFDEKYSESIIHLIEALKIGEEIQNESRYFGIHFELSESYRQIGDYKLATFHSIMACEISTKLKNENDILYSTAQLGGLYDDQNMWDKAAPLLETAAKLADNQNNDYIKQQIIALKADHLIVRKDFEGALKLYRDNLNHQIKTDQKNGIAWVYSVIARIFIDLNKRDSAYHYANLALDMSVKYNLVKEIRDSYETQFECHYKFGDFKKALEYRLAFDSIYNATYNLESAQKAERARMELEIQRKEVTARAAEMIKEANAVRDRNLMYTAFGIFSLAILFLFWNNRQKQKTKTKIEKAYSALKSTQAQLIQSEKMASLGELTAGIAHEIQNPLNFVNNFSELSVDLASELKEEIEKLDLPVEKIEYLEEIIADLTNNQEKINHHGKRASNIVKGMLEHSRTSTGLKTPTNINDLADEYLRLAYHGLRAKDKSFNASLKTDFDESIGNMQLISQDIGRVFLNLFTNAFYSINKKQKETEIVGYDPCVSITTKRKINMVEIVVEDNGLGIPQDIIHKIFQPFFTTKPTGDGTGLGLSLSYDIIKSHGGDIKVDSILGNSTKFIINLPL